MEGLYSFISDSDKKEVEKAFYDGLEMEYDDIGRIYLVDTGVYIADLDTKSLDVISIREKSLAMVGEL